jgi:hypothetical protein
MEKLGAKKRVDQLDNKTALLDRVRAVCMISNNVGKLIRLRRD